MVKVMTVDQPWLDDIVKFNKPVIKYLVGALEHERFFSHHIGNTYPNWRTNSIIFQRGWYNNHQPDKRTLIKHG